MKNKGFTKSELVVVIGVIIVIAAIVIPLAMKLQKNILIAPDVAVAGDLNKTLEKYASEKPIESFEDVVDTLKRDGYIFINMDAETEGCYYVWEAETNQIILVEKHKDTFKVLYSEKKGYGNPDDSWHFAVDPNK